MFVVAFHPKSTTTVLHQQKFVCPVREAALEFVRADRVTFPPHLSNRPLLDASPTLPSRPVKVLRADSFSSPKNL